MAFFLSNGEMLLLYHEADCCEQFWLEDFDGEPFEITNCVIKSAEERISRDLPFDNQDTERPGRYNESNTWTFYVIRSLRGTVTLRFCGSSNGYYSEGVNLVLYKI